MKHILTADQFKMHELERLFKTAMNFEFHMTDIETPSLLKNKILGNLFFEPSTRTRLSFASAFHRLGGFVQELGGVEATSIVKGESLADTIRIISSYVDVIVMRHPETDSVKKIAAYSSVPIINAGDGAADHPTQTLLDLYTIFKLRNNELKNINNLRISFVGDLKYSRTMPGLAKILNLFAGIEYTFVAPEPLQASTELVQLLKNNGHHVVVTADLKQGLQNSDVIYMTRIQEERFSSKEEANKFKGIYSINADNFNLYCQPHTVIMHPLPRDSRPGNEEIAQNLDNHPNLLIFKQAANGVPIRMALFDYLLA